MSDERLIPGELAIRQREKLLAERLMTGRKRGARTQKGVDGLGLFDPDARADRQGDLVELLK